MDSSLPECAFLIPALTNQRPPSPDRESQKSSTATPPQQVSSPSVGSRAETPAQEPDPGFLFGYDTWGRTWSLGQPPFPLHIVG